MQPKVSVIIPTYNRAWCLKEAIQSVLNQTFRDFELIIVDDGSTDPTRELLKPYQQNTHIRCFFEPHTGACTARNKGMEKAQGSYIGFLDSDDVWLPDKLERQVAFMEQHQEITLVHGFVEMMDLEGNPLPKETARVHVLYKKAQRQGEDYAGLTEIAVLLTSAILIRKEGLRQVGYFDPDAGLREDLDLCLRITLAGFRMAFLGGHPVARYRFRGREAHANAAVLRKYLYIFRKNLALLENGKLPEIRKKAYRNLLLRIADCHYSLDEFKPCREFSFRAIQIDPRCLLRLACLRKFLITLMPLRIIAFLRQIKNGSSYGVLRKNYS